jgi:methylglyoxal synthase
MPMTDLNLSPQKYGLVAHRWHRQHRDSALPRWARAADTAVRNLKLHLLAVGGSFDALGRFDLLSGYAGLQRLPNGREGGLMRVVSRVAGGLSPGEALDGVIFLMDPVDPSSNFPEAQALKRQCVTHGKPFVPTLVGAMEWMAVESLHAGLPAHGVVGIAPWLRLHEQTVALIAHDARKKHMLEFAAAHFELLSRYQERVATGTTGGLLNELAWSRGWPAALPWVTRYQSGPLGGDAQIAELVMDGRCQKVIFFEDPHVARQHEADIQLMERAVWSAGDRCSCLNSPSMAYRWAQALGLAGAGGTHT